MYIYCLDSTFPFHFPQTAKQCVTQSVAYGKIRKKWSVFLLLEWQKDKNFHCALISSSQQFEMKGEEMMKKKSSTMKKEKFRA